MGIKLSKGKICAHLTGVCVSAFLLAACDKAKQTRAQNTVDPAAAGQGQWFVSAANPYATQAGAEILKRGGSAVDAAIAVEAVLGLVEPQSSGLGGGAFMLHYDPATRSLVTYDGREVAPMSATPERFLDENGEPMGFYDAVAGGLSVGVPGMVAMLALAHEEHGNLAWEDLLVPAQKLAEAGFEVSPRLANLLTRISRLKQLPAAAAYFYDREGAPWPVGHVLKNPAYAATLQKLRDGGPRVFYQGEIAEAIVEAVNTAPNPGGMTLDDIAGYEPIKRAPVCGPYRSYRICSMAPPSSGGVTVLQMLALLEPFDLGKMEENSVGALHLLFEASRLAYADRAKFLADQDQTEATGGLSSEALIAGLLNPLYLQARADLISPDRRMDNVTAGDPSVFAYDQDMPPGAWKTLGLDASPDLPSTSHFSIVDGKGRVVSMTATVEFAFGSHLMAGGMVLNNQLTDFSFLPVRDGVPVANAVGPKKRPRSSMTPTLVFDENGDIWSAIGSPGGPAIIGYVANVLLGIIDWELSMQDAINRSHAVFPRGNPILEAEKFDPQVKAALEAMGHEITERDLTSGLHGFIRTKTGFDGGADPRREGTWMSGPVEMTN